MNKICYNHAVMHENSEKPWYTPKTLLIDLLLLVVIGIIFCIPLMDYSYSISPGDSGRDLYAAQEILNGKVPYQDFSWAYGPLMPYYTAIFYTIFGVKIQSLLFAKLAARIITGIFLYLSAATLFPRILSIVCTLWFWGFYSDFGHTMNHTLGLSAMMMTCCALLFYRKHLKLKYLWMGLVPAFLLALIKLNFGLVSLIALVSGAILTDVVKKEAITKQKRIFYATALLAVPAACAAVYWLFLHRLPDYEVRQALPFSGNFLQHEIPWTQGVYNYLSTIYSEFIGLPFNKIFGAIVLLSLINMIRMWTTNQLSRAQKMELGLIIALLGIFYLAGMHEYIRNATDYRRLWAKPFTVLLFFVIIHATYIRSSLLMQRTVICVLALTILEGRIAYNNLFAKLKTPSHYLPWPRAKVYTFNDPEWINTVQETTGYLQKNLRPDELFFALPHDALYYFLMDRQSPTRHLSFFTNEHIAVEQEQDVIRSLEQHHVRYIVLSNRSISDEPGMGNFGEDYCLLLKSYIDHNFEMVSEFGDWTKPPLWSNNHATKIFKRKTSK